MVYLPGFEMEEFRKNNLQLGDIYVAAGYDPGTTTTGTLPNLTRIVELGESTFTYLTSSGRTEFSERYDQAKGFAIRETDDGLLIICSPEQIGNLLRVDRVLRGAESTSEKISRLKFKRE